MLVLQDSQLYVRSFDVGLVFVGEREDVPPSWLFELDLLDFLQFEETVGSTDADKLWCVAFVCFEIKVKSDFLDPHLLQELDVYKVWLVAIALPESGDQVVTQLVDTVSVFCRAERPDREVAHFPPLAVARGRELASAVWWHANDWVVDWTLK